MLGAPAMSGPIAELPFDRLPAAIQPWRVRSIPLRRATLAALALAFLFALTLVYTKLSTTAPIDSDNANLVLEGEAMARGNLLLRGWVISVDSYITTEVPLYAVGVLLHGVLPVVAHQAAALLYAGLVLVAMLLAARGVAGPRGWLAMLVTMALLLAPSPGPAVVVLLLGPYHVSTMTLLLLGLLALDRARAAWPGALLFGLLLTLGQMADPLAIYIGAAPVALVCCVRLAGATGVERRRDLGVLSAVGASVAAAQALLGLVRLAGGVTLVPIPQSFVPFDGLPTTGGAALHGLLVLFGADFFGQPLGPESVGSLLHLLGFVFVVAVVWSAIAAWRRGQERDRVNQVLVTMVVVDLAAYVLSVHATDLLSSRYLLPALVSGAVLAGRVGADRLAMRGLAAPALAVVALYAGLLGWTLATATPRPSTAAELGAWLDHRSLHYGLGGYWEASAVTVETGGRVRVRAVAPAGDVLRPNMWDTNTAWYDAGVPGNDARFVVWDTRRNESDSRRLALAAFGPPSEVQRVGPYEVLIYDRNLLRRLD